MVPPGAPTAAPPGPVGVDPVAFDNARREIHALAAEIAELARSQVPPEQFFESILTRMVAALAAVGGAVWTVGEGGNLNLAWQLNLKQAQLDDPQHQLQHQRLLGAVLRSGESKLVPPGSGSGDTSDEAAANPTDFLLVLGVVGGDGAPDALIEIFQRPGTAAATQRGYLRFARQMCELAGDYFQTRRLRQAAEKQRLLQQLDHFATAVHASLDPRRTAYTLANEGRRLIGCDRVSVAIGRGRNCRIAAISGQDTLETRSNIVVSLRRLASVVLAAGEKLWYYGDASDLPPQLQRALDAYIDLAHSKMVAVVPLLPPGKSEGDADAPGAEHARPEPVGALILEQLADSESDPSLQSRAEAVARHGAAAVSNASEHDSILLLPLWRALGQARLVAQARVLPKAALVLAALLAVVLVLALVPADFKVEARGTLQPAVRREVFAGIDGVVINVPVDHGSTVTEGALLAELRNTDLEVEITDLVGRREAISKQITSLQRALLGENQLPVEEQNRLSGQLMQLTKTHESLDRQLILYQQKQQALKVTSEIAGQVVTWQVRQKLLRRPVRQGQILMSLADPTGPWELELYVPEDRMGHVTAARKRSDEPLKVNYVLATAPGSSFTGEAGEIQRCAELRGEHGNTVLMRVNIDKNQHTDLRPGATVTARIDCGRRSLGYVWLHDLIAFVQAKILFRL